MINQFHLHSEQFHIRTIAEYSHVLGLNTSCSTCREITWPGTRKICFTKNKSIAPSGAIPVDTERNEIRRLVMNAAEITLITVTCISALGLAVFFLAFNIIHRHER